MCEEVNCAWAVTNQERDKAGPQVVRQKGEMASLRFKPRDKRYPKRNTQMADAVPNRCPPPPSPCLRRPSRPRPTPPGPTRTQAPTCRGVSKFWGPLKGGTRRLQGPNRTRSHMFVHNPNVRASVWGQGRPGFIAPSSALSRADGQEGPGN